MGDTISVTVIRYAEVGLYQTMGNSIFGYGYCYGSDSSSGQLMVSGGYEEVTVDVTLEGIEAE